MNILTIKEKSCLFARKRYIYMRWNVWDVWDVQRPKRPDRPGRPETFAQIAKPILANVPRQTFSV